MVLFFACVGNKCFLKLFASEPKTRSLSPAILTRLRQAKAGEIWQSRVKDWDFVAVNSNGRENLILTESPTEVGSKILRCPMTNLRRVRKDCFSKPSWQLFVHTNSQILHSENISCTHEFLTAHLSFFASGQKHYPRVTCSDAR